ncbi:MAG: DUF4974 domain-containing protein [Cyclobacteriaceae bacterium]|nr:DUF4974 domain-containing protein [Cyclobacteriaceae bacterium]
MDIAQMVKILEGKGSESELNAFSHWMAISELHRQEFKQVRQLWQLAQGPWPTTTNQLPLLRIKNLMKTRKRMLNYKKGFVAMTCILLLSIVIRLWWPVSVASTRADESLAFDHTSLKEVAVLLETKFNIDIQIAEAGIEACLFTGSFSKATTLHDIMHAISLSLSVSVSDTRSGYEWKGTGC